MRRTAVLLLAFLVTMAIPAGPSLTLAQSTDWPSVIRAVRPAVVWILVETDEDLDDAGTGAILSEDGYILTAHHVIEDATGEISVIVEEKYRYTASVISSDADADIAILKIPATGLTWVPLGDSDQVDIEEEIRVFGYPLPGAGVGLIVVSGIIQGTRTRDGVRWLQHNATTAGGHSGGPVVNSQGQIIAVHSRVLVEQPEYRLATAVNEARQFIPSGVLPVGTPTPAPLTTYTVSGRVTTSSGSGVAGVSITFSRTSGTGTIPGSVTTDSNGRWTRTGFASGTTYRATPSQSGYTFSPSSRTFSSASTSVSFTRGTPSSPTPTPTPPSPSTPPSGMVLSRRGVFRWGTVLGVSSWGTALARATLGSYRSTACT
ncbi:MAG TPA: trypsin-like serine protease [Candidatus Acetothermia bacterium]|nr:trypsin-like serine protease [Candidatus Acetothermia bacterium]